MGFFDGLLNSAANSAANGAIDKVNNVGRGQNESKTFTFTELPANLEQFKALPEANLDSPYKTAALALIALTRFESSVEDCYEMLNYLYGPEPMSNYAKSFIKDRLNGKEYKIPSFFAGATVENGYIPSQPLSITVSSNPYSFDEENWATIYVKSAGADSPRPLKLRRKPSTNQWFLTEIQCLADIRIPATADPWA